MAVFRVRLADSLLREAKREAAKCGLTLTAIIRLTTTGHGGPRPGIDLDDSASLLDAMDDVE